MLQQIKHFIRDTLNIPPVAMLFMAGCGAHLVLNALLRKAPTSPWGLLAPLLLGLTLESWEIWIQYRSIGLAASGNDPIAAILMRHVPDVGIVLAGPVLLVVLSRLQD